MEAFEKWSALQGPLSLVICVACCMRATNAFSPSPGTEWVRDFHCETKISVLLGRENTVMESYVAGLLPPSLVSPPPPGYASAGHHSLRFATGVDECFYFGAVA